MGALYKKYGNGGQPGPKKRTPIVVTNPNDPRLKAYSDSLRLTHRYDYKDSDLLLNTKRTFYGNIDPTNGYNPNKSYSDEPIQPIGQEVYDTKAGGKHYYGIYKPPVQPVVYQKPQNNKTRRPLTDKEKEFWKDPKTGLSPLYAEVTGIEGTSGSGVYFGNYPKEQPEKIFPMPVKSQAKINITSPQQSQIEIPKPKPTNWSFTYPGEAGVNKQQYFNSQTEYDTALKLASSGNPIGNSNFMGSKQEGNQYSSQFRTQPKYQNGGSMRTLYSAYRKNKLAGGGFMNNEEHSAIETEIPPVIGGGSRSYIGAKDTGHDAVGSQGTLGTSATRAGNKVNWGAAASGVAGIANEVIDSSGKGDPLTGRKSIGSSIAKGAISGAATGTSILPGWGTLIGAVVGGAAGWISGGSKRRKARAQMGNEINANRTDAINYSANLSASNPSLYQGYKGADYYGKYGGSMTKFGMGGKTDMSAPLATMYMNGGRAKSLSSDNAELIGNSHKQGGIHIPEMGAEVEGGETTVGDYVFSKKLGFADLHKPIAKAKGKIEAKPMTADRVNALRRLKGEEQSMMLSQEYFKHKLNLN